MRFVFLLISFLTFSVSAKDLPSTDKIKNFLSEERVVKLTDWEIKNDYQSASVDDSVFIINKKSVSVMKGIKDENDNIVGMLLVLNACMKVSESVLGTVSEKQKEDLISTILSTAKVPGKKISSLIGGYRFETSATSLGKIVMFDCSINAI